MTAVEVLAVKLMLSGEPPTLFSLACLSQTLPMPVFLRIRRAGAAQILIIGVFLSLILLYKFRSTSTWVTTAGTGEEIESSTTTALTTSVVPVSSNTPLKSPQRREKELVVASLKGDDVSWLYNNITEWTKNIYVVDDPSASLTVPVNKGRESMVYLTYDIPPAAQAHLSTA